MKESIGLYKARDGTPLFFRKWSGRGDVIVYLHGIESNSGWFSPFASRFNERGFTIYGIERRGSGLNKDGEKGDITDYRIFLDDIEDALRFVNSQNKGKKIYIMGICWGGLLAVNYAVTERMMPDGLILLSPAVYRRIDFNVVMKAIVRLYLSIRPTARFAIPIRDRMFTANERFLDFIRRDSMRLRTLTCRFFNEILKMERDFSRVNHRIPLPTAVLLAGRDEIIDNKRVKEWFSKLESNDKRLMVFSDSYHVIPFEQNIEPIVDFVTEWIGAREMPIENARVKN